MTTKQPWQKVIEEQVPTVHGDFYSPLIPLEVRLHDEETNISTAWIDFRTNETHIVASFLDDLVKKAGLEQDVAVRGILKHEFGHYVIYPRECAQLLFLGHIADSQWKKYHKHVLAYWIDVLDNLPQILKEHRGKEVRELYRGMNTLFEQEQMLPDQTRKLLEGLQINPDQLREVLRQYSVDRLLTAYYQAQSKQDLGVDLSDAPYLEEKLKELMTINYLDTASEITNFVLFGTIIKEVLEKLEENLPKVPEDVLKKLLEPYITDAPDMKDFSDKQIEEGLDYIIRKWGKRRYEMIRDYVERQTGKKYDQPERNRPGIGLERTELQFHDDQIPYYERKARTYGLHIHKKPLIVDVRDQYPEGKHTFHVGDPVRTLDPFSTGGRVLPGITKRHQLKAGTKKDKQYRVPHLLIVLDSSGSMIRPEEGSPAITAGFVAARNYWENGAEVGVMNFSGDTAFLLPTRNLEQVYSMNCAYWGGGTTPNIEKIKEYMRRIHGGEKGVFYTTEKDYERVIERMDPSERREYLDKNLQIDLKGGLQQTYEKLDTIMITDGGIANLEEVITYFNATAEVTRNTIFLLTYKDKDGTYNIPEEFQQELLNTQVIPVTKDDDLVNIVIGGPVKSMVPEQPRPASLFYEGR